MPINYLMIITHLYNDSLQKTRSSTKNVVTYHKPQPFKCDLILKKKKSDTPHYDALIKTLKKSQWPRLKLANKTLPDSIVHILHVNHYTMVLSK